MDPSPLDVKASPSMRLCELKVLDGNEMPNIGKTLGQNGLPVKTAANPGFSAANPGIPAAKISCISWIFGCLLVIHGFHELHTIEFIYSMNDYNA